MKSALNLLIGIVIGALGVFVVNDITKNDELEKEIEYNVPNEIIMELEFYRHNHDRLVKGIEGESE